MTWDCKNANAWLTYRSNFLNLCLNFIGDYNLQNTAFQRWYDDSNKLPTGLDLMSFSERAALLNLQQNNNPILNDALVQFVRLSDRLYFTVPMNCDSGGDYCTVEGSSNDGFICTKLYCFSNLGSTCSIHGRGTETGTCLTLEQMQAKDFLCPISCPSLSGQTSKKNVLKKILKRILKKHTFKQRQCTSEINCYQCTTAIDDTTPCQAEDLDGNPICCSCALQNPFDVPNQIL